MADNLNNNPFSALFPSVEEAKVFCQEAKPQLIANLQQTSPRESTVDVQEQIQITINNIIESVFLITITNDPSNSTKCPSHCVYLQELHDVLHDQKALDLSILEQAVFERLMLENPRDCLIVLRGSGGSSSNAEEEAIMTQNLHYLYLCFHRSKKLETQYQEKFKNVLEKCQIAIISNSRMMLCHPEIYEKQNSSQQFIDLFLEYAIISGHNDIVLEFLDLIVSDSEKALLNGDDDISLEDLFQPILNLLLEKIRAFTLVDTSLFRHLPVLHFFSRTQKLAKILIDHSTPKQSVMGKSFESTLLGYILHISCLPHSELGPFEFFDQPSRYSQQEHSITEKNLWMPISSLNNELFEIMFRILKMPFPARHAMLKWIGTCLQANSGRAKLWTHIQTLLSTEVSDAFMLNLGGILLRLSKPFSEPQSPKLLKLDPTYSAAVISNEEEMMHKGIYLTDLHKETTLIPADDGKRIFSSSYNFTTSCFFLTHRCLNLGFHAVHERFLQLNQELARTQRLYEEARGQAGENSEAVQNIKTVMERGMSQFLSIKTVLLEPNNLELALNFHIASATWLTHLASRDNLNEFQPINFPLPEQASHFLTYIPEFIVDGIADFIIFLRRFSPRTLELCGEHLGYLMTFILVFMGDQNRIKNPHLRAKLAEMLESLIPHQDDKTFSPVTSLFHRTRLFQEHPHIRYLAPTLLNVFVSIEMTGQSVAFEQKFKYRRPMYIVMDYLWGFDLHKQAFKVLASEAEQNMESTQPPLFLRFINLLINDAIFLLDEALLYMTQLREQQQLRENGELQNLPAEQRQQNEANFQQMGLLARFHNVMGNSTIHVLELITREIRSIFSHPTIVDRIAAMLNYFLLHLVGPKKKQLKVKDLTEYEFKPQELVRDICQIYLHLGDSDKFCLAVSQDGRSYSPELFDLAQNVLQKIGQASLISDLIQLADNVKEMATQQQAEDEALGEIPDEFLDPIMGTLMTDPVLLPSSKVTVDRATIARHLLSDQTDPFNRSPLTMDQIAPDEDKKQQLQQWLDSHSKIKQRKNNESKKNNNISSEGCSFDES